MSCDLHPVSTVIGAEVTGIDLSRKPDDGTVTALLAAAAAHGVLVFRDQVLTPEQQVAFTQRFGALEEHVLRDALLPGHPEIYVLSNRVEGGQPVGRSYAGAYWHSDLSYAERPSLGSMLYALEVPELGGDTLFASMYAALDGLSDGMRASLRKLRAVHDFGHANRTIFAQRADGGTLTAEQQASTPPMEHPVVRRHPVTGREALFVNPGFTARFADMTPEESRPLLDYLFEQATDPAIVYRHRWRVGDLVFWDNQCVMHKAICDYGDDQPRHMFRTTIRGEAPIAA